MMYLATASGPLVREAMADGLLGLMNTPASRYTLIDGVPWAADNGCFADAWEADDWWAWLLSLPPTSLFAVAPDVVGDAEATRVRSEPWLGRIRQLGHPVAYVLQDGAQEVPWDDIDWLFIGGSTTYKLSAEAARWGRCAKERGKGLHMGRVNTLSRLRYAAELGCDSVDGTFLVFGPDVNLPRLLRYLRWARSQPSLFGEGAVS